MTMATRRPPKSAPPAPKAPAPPKALAVHQPAPLAPIDPATLEKALIGGDLGALNPAQRMEYYSAVCQSLQLNPLTRPLEFTTIDGKTLLYARKDCTEQLRRRDGIKIVIAERKTEGGLHWVTAKASLTSGREDEAIGVVPMEEPSFVTDWHPTERGKRIRVENPHKGKPLSAADRAKAMMLAETKAKRRVTLSIAGLGIPDESELEPHFEPAPEPAAVAQAEEKKIEEKIAKEGGTVTKIEPEKGVEALIVEDMKAYQQSQLDETERLLDVECHLGEANGCWLGKKVRDIVPKALKALWNDRILKMAEKPTNKDARLRDAVKARKAIMEADGTWPKDAPETPAKAPGGKSTAPKPPEGEKPAKRGNTTDASEPAFDWKTVPIPMGAAKGQRLDSLPDDKLRQCFCFGLPALTMDTPEEKQFYEAVQAGVKERNCLTDADRERQSLVVGCLGALQTKSIKEMNEGIARAGLGKILDMTDAQVTECLTDWDAMKSKLEPDAKP